MHSMFVLTDVHLSKTPKLHVPVSWVDVRSTPVAMCSVNEVSVIYCAEMFGGVTCTSLSVMGVNVHSYCTCCLHLC